MKFRYVFTVESPVDKVSAFHRDPRALERLTPRLLWKGWVYSEPIAEGSISHFMIGVGPVRIRWIARHRDVSDLGFTDEQLEGPFQRWVHVHRFEALGPGRTRVVEEIEASWPRHPLRWAVAAGIWIGLPFLFAYRARRIQGLLGAGR